MSEIDCEQYVGRVILCVGLLAGCEANGSGESPGPKSDSGQPRNEATGAADRPDGDVKGGAASDTERETYEVSGVETAAEQPPELPSDAQRVDRLYGPSERDESIEIYRVPAGTPSWCETSGDLLLRLYLDGDYTDQRRLEVTCSGACTEEDRREGERKVEELERKIESGEGDPSELDYNYTDCIALDHRVRHAFHELGRLVLLVESDYLGPHDGNYNRARLVTFGCGGLEVSEPFLHPYGSRSVVGFSSVRAIPGHGDKPWRKFRLDVPAPAKALDHRVFAPALTGSFDAEACGWRLREVEHPGTHVDSHRVGP